MRVFALGNLRSSFLSFLPHHFTRAHVNLNDKELLISDLFHGMVRVALRRAEQTVAMG